LYMNGIKGDLTVKRWAVIIQAQCMLTHVLHVSKKASEIYSLSKILFGLSYAAISKTYTQSGGCRTKSQADQEVDPDADPEAHWLPAIVNGAQDDAVDTLWKNAKPMDGIFSEDVLWSNRQTFGGETFYPCVNKSLERISNVYNEAVQMSNGQLSSLDWTTIREVHEVNGGELYYQREQVVR